MSSTFSVIIVKYKTTTYLYCSDRNCIWRKKGKVVTVGSADQKRKRTIVFWTICSDGQNPLPFILVGNEHLVSRKYDTFKKNLFVLCASTSWTDRSATSRSFRVNLKNKVFSEIGLLERDVFGIQRSRAASVGRKKEKSNDAYILESCTKCIRAPDVSCNQSFEVKVYQRYKLWVANNKQYARMQETVHQQNINSYFNDLALPHKVSSKNIFSEIPHDQQFCNDIELIKRQVQHVLEACKFVPL